MEIPATFIHNESGRSDRAIKGFGLRPLACCDRGFESIKDDLLEIANQMYIDGIISDNQKHGLIVYVPKKLRPTRPEDFRRLTLLSADLKLITRILANRTSPWLTSALHPSQHCGIYGHSIFEATATVREAIPYTEYKRTSMYILSFDFKEAFDNITYDYLFQF